MTSGAYVYTINFLRPCTPHGFLIKSKVPNQFKFEQTGDGETVLTSESVTVTCLVAVVVEVVVGKASAKIYISNWTQSKKIFRRVINLFAGYLGPFWGQKGFILV